jgi:hypothetical protein
MLLKIKLFHYNSNTKNTTIKKELLFIQNEIVVCPIITITPKRKKLPTGSF